MVGVELSGEKMLNLLSKKVLLRNAGSDLAFFFFIEMGFGDNYYFLFV